MMYLRFLILFMCMLLVSSCATILNSNTAPVHIMLSEPSTVLIDQDTIAKDQTAVFYRAESRKPNILVHASNENQVKEFYLDHKPTISALSGNWLMPVNYIGMIMNTVTDRAMTYPRIIYIDFDDSKNAYVTHTPWFDVKKNIIKFTPLKTWGIVNPAIELAYERMLTNRISAQTKIGYLLPHGVYKAYMAIPPDRKGYLISVEPKIYLKDKAPYGLYLGMEGSFLRSDYARVESFKPPIEDDNYSNEERESYYQDSIGVHKRNSAINLKIGYLHTYKRWVLDAYVGLGAFHKHVWHTDRLHPEHTSAATHILSVWQMPETENRGWIIGVPMNIAVGYRF